MINIKGISKGKVLAELYNNSKPLGMGMLHYDPAIMLEEDAMIIIGDAHTTYSNRGNLFFDYLKGRVMKVDITGDEFDPWLYDRDNGEGSAQRVIDNIIKEK